MHVGMFDGLPGRPAHVDPNVETVRAVFAKKSLARLGHQEPDRALLLGGEGKEVRLVTSGNNKHVAGA